MHTVVTFATRKLKSPATATTTGDKMKCGYCGWEWKPRVKYPKNCPTCYRLIRESVAKRREQMNKPIEIRPLAEAREINERLDKIKEKAGKGGL